MRWIIAALILLLVVVVVGYVVTMLRSPAVDDSEVVNTYQEAGDRRVTVDGLTFRVREQGPMDAPTLVMIHGFSLSLESFDALADALDDDYRILRFDLPAHGLTGPDPQMRYSNEETVALVERLMDELGVMRATFIGNSLGGLVSWRYAVARPDRVAGLVLLAPGGFSINGVTEEPVPVPMPVSLYLKNAPEAGVRAGLQSLYADPAKVDDAMVERVVAMMKVNDNGTALVERLKVFTLPDPTGPLGQVTAPTLIIWGEGDSMIPVDHAAQFEAAMTAAPVDVVRLSNVGHVPHNEATQEVADLTRDFLKKVYGDAP